MLFIRKFKIFIFVQLAVTVNSFDFENPTRLIRRAQLLMTTKKFKISGQDIKQLIKSIGGCMATDKITVEGKHVAFMYRATPDFKDDSGWRFLSGTETQEYADNPENWAIYDVNTIANYDSSIIDVLDSPIGTELERIRGTNKFRKVEP